MPYKKIHAVVKEDALERVRERLQEMHVHNLTVAHVKGYGEHDELFAFRSSYRYAWIEIFCQTARAEEIAHAIVEMAHSGLPGDGVVAILPVETMYRIRTKAEARPEDFRDGPSPDESYHSK